MECTIENWVVTDAHEKTLQWVFDETNGEQHTWDSPAGLAGPKETVVLDHKQARVR
jgi:hypothetical protein